MLYCFFRSSEGYLIGEEIDDCCDARIDSLIEMTGNLIAYFEFFIDFIIESGE